MNEQDRLTETLRQRADRLDAELGTAHPISLDDVRQRAGGIRRRRAALSGLAAAAVLAVAVPVGLSVTDRTSGGIDSGPVATTTADPTRTSEATPLPEGSRTVLLTNRVESTSSAPGIAYLRSGTLVTPDGGEIDLATSYDELTPWGDGWVGYVRGNDDPGQVDLLDADGDVLSTRPAETAPAVSEAGQVVAYGAPGGGLMVVAPDAEPQLLRELRDGRPRPVGVVSGSGTCDEETGGGVCVVFFDELSADGEDGPEARYASSHGILDTLPALVSVGGAAPDGRVSGTTEFTEDGGSCSALLAADWSTQWETCDHSLGRFSPDGRLVIGYPAYRSGAGDASVAMLDAATGEVLVEFRNDAETQAFVGDVEWDVDGSLLATVYERGSWSLMRMTLGGQLTEVLADVGGDDVTPSVVLATGP